MLANKYNRTAQEQDALMADLWCIVWNSYQVWGWDCNPDELRRAFQIARRWFFS